MRGAKVGFVRDVPGPKSKKFIQQLLEVGVPLYRDFLGTGVHMPIFKEGKGIYLTDMDENVYLDTHAAMACITHGYDARELKEAIREQAEKLPAVLAMGPSLPRFELAKKLVEECAPGDLRNAARLQFETGGSAAVDLAIKMALFYGSTTRQFTADKIIAFDGAYHGTGSLGMIVSDNPVFREKLPTGIEVIRVPYPYCYRCFLGLRYPECDMACVKFVERLFESPSRGLYNPITKKSAVTALIVEPVQSHGGTIVPPKEFYPRVRALCNKYDITFIDDEICGFLWSGKYWFCCEHYNTTPDMIVIGKGFSGGFGPLGGIIVEKHISEVLNENSFWHMTTYQGHPLACAAALTNLNILKKERMLERVDELGKYFLSQLKKLQKNHKTIGDARGMGFMGALEFVRDKKTKVPAPEIAKKVGLEALRRGITGYTGLGDYGNVMHWHLPLIIKKEEIAKLVEILDISMTVAERKEGG